AERRSHVWIEPCPSLSFCQAMRSDGVADLTVRQRFAHEMKNATSHGFETRPLRYRRFPRSAQHLCLCHRHFIAVAQSGVTGAEFDRAFESAAWSVDVAIGPKVLGHASQRFAVNYLITERLNG